MDFILNNPRASPTTSCGTDISAMATTQRKRIQFLWVSMYGWIYLHVCFRIPPHVSASDQPFRCLTTLLKFLQPAWSLHHSYQRPSAHIHLSPPHPSPTTRFKACAPLHCTFWYLTTYFGLPPHVFASLCSLRPPLHRFRAPPHISISHCALKPPSTRLYASTACLDYPRPFPTPHLSCPFPGYGLLSTCLRRGWDIRASITRIESSPWPAGRLTMQSSPREQRNGRSKSLALDKAHNTRQELRGGAGAGAGGAGRGCGDFYRCGEACCGGSSCWRQGRGRDERSS
jgi:hypothetical protein